MGRDVREGGSVLKYYRTLQYGFSIKQRNTNPQTSPIPQARNHGYALDYCLGPSVMVMDYRSQ